jgi:TP901 family phage tail tape measure protein
MNNNLNFLLNFQTNADKVTATINKLDAATINVSKAAIKVDNAFVGVINNINKKIGNLNFSNMMQQANSVASGFQSLAQPGLELSSSLGDLSAITGVTGTKLKEIEGYARESAKTFGGSAAQGVEAYKLVLSQLSPEIAKAPAALKSMGDSINTLSKTMGGDTAAATEVLTTAMNQYQVSTADPIQASKEMATMMNVMAAAANAGSAEMPQIKTALEQSGLAAKTAGVSFAETNAAIQVLDKAGKKGAEGGVALRNVMTTLSEGRFLPKDVKAELAGAGININALGDKSKTLAERLSPLKKIMGDQALVTKLFGKENSAAAIAMISGIEEQKRLTTAIIGTNAAYESAALVMEEPAEKNKKLQAQIDNFKISLFNGTSGMLGYMGVVSDLTRSVTDIAPLFILAGKAVDFITSKEKLQAFWTSVLAVKNKAVAITTSLWTGAQTMLNIAMNANPIGLIIAAIVALVAMIAVAINYYDQFGAAILLIMGPIGWVINGIMTIRDHWDSITRAFQSEGIIGGFKRIGIVLLDVLLKPLQQILEIIAKIDPTGLAQKGANSIKAFRKSQDLVTAGEKVSSTAAGKKVAGIAQPSIPGITPRATQKGLGSGGGPGAKTNDAIATGGTKNTVVNIVIKEMNGVKTNILQGAKDAVDKTTTGIEDAILRTLAMASSAGS